MDTYESEEIAMETIKKSMYWEPNTNIYQYKDKKLKGLKNISLSKKMKLIKNDKTDNVIFIWGKDCNLIKDNKMLIRIKEVSLLGDRVQPCISQKDESGSLEKIQKVESNEYFYRYHKTWKLHYQYSSIKDTSIWKNNVVTSFIFVNKEDNH